MKKIAYFAIPLIIFIASSLLLMLGIDYNWLGEEREGIMKFCENARVGLSNPPIPFQILVLALPVFIWHGARLLDTRPCALALIDCAFHVCHF